MYVGQETLNISVNCMSARWHAHFCTLLLPPSPHPPLSFTWLLFVNRPKSFVGMLIVAAAAVVVSGYKSGCVASQTYSWQCCQIIQLKMMFITFTLYSKLNMLYRLIISDLILFINFFLVMIVFCRYYSAIFFWW